MALVNSIKLLALVSLPAVCSITYQVVDARLEWQEKLHHQQLEQEKAAWTASQPVEPLSKALDYPVLPQAEPLSRIVQLRSAVQSAAETEPANAVNSQSIEIKPERSDEELDLSALDLSELSPELAQAVQSVFRATGDEPDKSQSADLRGPLPESLPDNVEKYRGQLPAMDLQYHMYVSDENRRYVKINGKELREGEWLSDEVQLISISQRSVVIDFNGTRIDIPALYEWQG